MPLGGQACRLATTGYIENALGLHEVKICISAQPFLSGPIKEEFVWLAIAQQCSTTLEDINLRELGLTNSWGGPWDWGICYF